MGRNIFSRKKQEQPRRSPVVGTASRPKPMYYGSDKPRSMDSLQARYATEQRRKLSDRLRAAPTLIALAVILISVVYSTTLTTPPGIKFVGDHTDYRTAAEYKNGISKLLSSSLWNRSKLTLNTTTTEAAILKTFPEVDVANVSLPIIGRRPTVTLHVEKPALILTTKTNAFVLNNGGKIVAETKQLASGALAGLITAQDQSGLVLHLGDQALTTDTMTFLYNVNAQLAAKQLTIDNVVLLGGGNEIDVHIKNLPFYLKTDGSGDARVEIGSFLAAQASGINPSTYMDVRIEEKIFYK